MRLLYSMGRYAPDSSVLYSSVTCYELQVMSYMPISDARLGPHVPQKFAVWPFEGD